MSPLSPEQMATRRRVEALIRLAEPGLNLLLAAGDRVSRVVHRGDDDVEPVRLPARDARLRRGTQRAEF